MADEINAVIGRDIIVRGEIQGSETLLVEGRVEGTVKLDAELVVGETGVVEAEIDSVALTVEGEFNGSALCREVITLVSGCHGTGEISAPRVVIEDGAVFTGTLNMDTGIVEGRGE